MEEHSVFERVHRSLTTGQRFVITTHVNPDGDGLGSEAAVAAYLNDLGKDVYIYNSSPTPPNYDFLDPHNQIEVYNSDNHRETVLTADYVIVLDISDWQRLRRLGEDVREVAIKKICIDHHPGNEQFGDIRLVDTGACSTGEIVFRLLEYCGATISERIAEALYASILTDTGSFRFSNTSASCLQIASKLVEHGANPNTIYQRIYERQSLAKTKLLAYIINNLNFAEDGKIAWFSISKDVLDNLGAKPYDTEGFADYPRVVNGVEVSLMFNEMEHGRIKVSIRSKGKYVINGLAQKLGGGGHPFAAGVLLKGKLEEVINQVRREVRDLLNMN